MVAQHIAYSGDMKPRTFAIPDELVTEVDGYARRLETEHPGVRMTRSDAVRALLRRGLDAEARTT